MVNWGYTITRGRRVPRTAELHRLRKLYGNLYGRQSDQIQCPQVADSRTAGRIYGGQKRVGKVYVVRKVPIGVSAGNQHQGLGAEAQKRAPCEIKTVDWE